MIKLALTFQEAEALHKILSCRLLGISQELAAPPPLGCDLLRSEEESVRRVIGSLEEQGIGVEAEIFGGYAE